MPCTPGRLSSGLLRVDGRLFLLAGKRRLVVRVRVRRVGGAFVSPTPRSHERVPSGTARNISLYPISLPYSLCLDSSPRRSTLRWKLERKPK